MAVKNWRIRTKLFILILIMGIAMAALGVFNIRITNTVVTANEDIAEVHLGLIENSIMARAKFQNVVTAIYQHISADSLGRMDDYEESIAKYENEVKAALNTLGSIKMESEDREIFEQIGPALNEYLDMVPLVVAASRNMEKSEALRISDQLRDIRKGKLMPLFDELVESISADTALERQENALLVAASNRNAIIGIIVATSLASLVGFYVTILITKPISEVNSVADALAAGDLTKRISYSSKDEIGKMSGALNNSFEKLQLLISQVMGIAGNVSESSQQLSASAEEVGQATQQVADTINQLAKGADEQAKAASQTGTVMEEMAHSVKHVAQLTKEMDGDAQTTVSASRQGLNLVDQAIKQMKAVEDSSKKASLAVNNLGSMSEEIGQIVEVINGIAEQTNLLALNAAIEAARAGEHGRGFAVVAEEVRKLAEQSRTATEQISTLIKQIQDETAEAVRTMEAGGEEVISGAQVVSQTGEAFEAITKAIAVVTEKIQRVNEASQELSSGSEKVVHSVESVAATAQQTAAGTEEISASAEEQNASVQQIASYSDSLRKMSEVLMAEISKFNFTSLNHGCWETMKCSSEIQAKCPAYKSEELRCWLVPGTWCGGVEQGDIESKRHRCMTCKFFKEVISQ